MTHFSLKIKKLLFLVGALAIALVLARGAAAEKSYVVVSGDTVCEIAEQFSVPCGALIETNQLGKDAFIVVGQRLILPEIGQTNTVEQAASAPEAEQVLPAQIEEPLGSGQYQDEENSSKAAADLWSIYLLARAHDQLFGAQGLRRDAARQALPQARAALRPQLSFDSSFSRAYDDDFDHNDSLQSTLSLTQSIYNRSNNLAIQQARHRVAAAEADYREAEQDLILRVTTAYFAVLSMTDNLELSEKNQEAIGRQLELALQRLNAGLGTRTDLYDAEARYESAVADGIEAAKLLDDAGQSLALLISSHPGTLRPMRPAILLPSPQPNDPEAWIDSALRDNHRLFAEKHNLSIAKLDAARQQASRLPVLGASLSGSFTDTEKTDSTRSSISVRLSVPLLRGGLVRSQIKEAVLNLNAAQLNYETSRRQIYTETRGAFLAISSRLRRIEALTEAVRASESALRAKEEGFAAGLNTNIEVLDGQRDLDRVERDYLKERYDYVLEVLKLEALVGDLTDDDVRRVNTWLN